MRYQETLTQRVFSRQIAEGRHLLDGKKGLLGGILDHPFLIDSGGIITNLGMNSISEVICKKKEEHGYHMSPQETL
ncbi:hypothetical protein CEXT_3891 [Caerostris extrusa]|uniref:Uncharacterized protein n=1 Tax=Caerostris extrusa TaxID=172846 RepID=A0AAV4RLS6_CAEEX|nr:hypothetical protein CEXT_3891 [Caerostris extrusa]